MEAPDCTDTGAEALGSCTFVTLMSSSQPAIVWKSVLPADSSYTKMYSINWGSKIEGVTVTRGLHFYEHQGQSERT